MKALLLGAAFIALCAPALAQDACAKYDDAFAYNQCLAAQGPKAHATRAMDAPAGESAAAPGVGRGRVHTVLQVVRRRNGRMFAEFAVGPTSGKSRQHRKPPDDGVSIAPSQ